MKDENDNSRNSLIKVAPEIYSSLSGTFPAVPVKPQEQPQKKVKYNSKQWLTLITLAFGNFCAGACVSLQAPFFPAEAEKKGATPTEYGFIFGIFQLTIFIMAPVMGKLVPYISPKLLLNSGILTVGVTCVVFGTLDFVEDRTSFVALAFVIRTVEGIGAAALRTSCYTIIASQFSEGIGTTFAVLETFLGIGLITGPTLGGALYDLGGYGLPFYVVGCIVIVDAIIIFFVLPNVEKASIPEKGNLFRFWMHPTVLIYSLSVFTSFNYIGFNQATLEPHIREFKLSGLFLGMMFALSGTIYALSAPVWGWLCDKKCNSKFLSLIGCIISVTSLLLVGPAPFFNIKPNLIIIITSLVLLGFALGAKLVCAFTGTLQDTIDRGFPPDLSTYGLISSMIASSQSLGRTTMLLAKDGHNNISEGDEMNGAMFSSQTSPALVYILTIGGLSFGENVALGIIQYFAFVGPSVGGFLLDTFGFRNASMALLILEITLVILLFISLFTKNHRRRTKMSESSVKENGHAVEENGHVVKENGHTVKENEHSLRENCPNYGSIGNYERRSSQ